MASGARAHCGIRPDEATGEPATHDGPEPDSVDSDLADLACLQTLLALLGLELHTLTLRKGAEALHLDLGLVDEQVIPAAVRRDESEAFFGVEPLDCTYTHN